jgi:hypothetical protein
MWVYEIVSGYLYSPTGRKMEPAGYSGNREGLNNPAMESVRDVGPLPEGVYDMDAPIDHPRLGPFAIPLIPRPENVMHGRNGFYIHAKRKTEPQSEPVGTPMAELREVELSSDGCIAQVRAIRQAAWLSLDHVLAVVAHYSDLAQPA